MLIVITHMPDIQLLIVRECYENLSVPSMR